MARKLGWCLQICVLSSFFTIWTFCEAPPVHASTCALQSRSQLRDSSKGQMVSSTTTPSAIVQKPTKFFSAVVAGGACRKKVKNERKNCFIFVAIFGRTKGQISSTTTLQYHHAFNRIREILFCDNHFSLWVNISSKWR